MYPFTYGGQQLKLSALSVGIKQAFVEWLEIRYLAKALRVLDTGSYIAERERVLAGAIYWTLDMSVAVAQAIYSDDGKRQLLRLLLGTQAKDWPDEKFDLLLAMKDQEPAGDFATAWDYVLEVSDPKKKSLTDQTSTPDATSPEQPDTLTSSAASAKSPSDSAAPTSTT